MHPLLKLHDLVVKTMCGLAVAMIAAIMLGVSLEVVMRGFGLGSLSGLVEATEYALYFSTFLSAPYLLRTNEHIRIDILIARLSARWRHALELATLWAVVVIAAVLVFYSGRVLIKHVQDGMLVFKEFVFPQWWLDWVIPLSALVFGLEALEQIVTGRRPGAPEPLPASAPKTLRES
jgi:TRAP-type transport system small permease protein